MFVRDTGRAPSRTRACPVSLGRLYELLAKPHAERAPIDEEHFVARQAMAVVGIVLREVAEAIDVEWGEGANRCAELLIDRRVDTLAARAQPARYEPSR